jgi:DNA-binding NtrC family response regulator
MYEATAVALQPVPEKGRVLLLSRDPELDESLKKRYFQVERVENAEAMHQHAAIRSFDLFVVDTRFPVEAEPDFSSRLREAAPESVLLFVSDPLEFSQDSLTLESIERRHIARVLGLTHGNFAKSARILGIDRTTLYNKVKRYKLSRE